MENVQQSCKQNEKVSDVVVVTITFETYVHMLTYKIDVFISEEYQVVYFCKNIIYINIFLSMHFLHFISSSLIPLLKNPGDENQ